MEARVVIDLADMDAVLEHYAENRKRAEYDDIAKGKFFANLHKKYGWSGLEIAARLGEDKDVVNACLRYSDDLPLLLPSRRCEKEEETARVQEHFADLIGASKYREVAPLPQKERLQALQAIAENRLTKQESRVLTKTVREGHTVEKAEANILLLREKMKVVRNAVEHQRASTGQCPCGTPYVVWHTDDMKHELELLRVLETEERP